MNPAGPSYAEFGAWYDTYRSAVLEPALSIALEALQQMLRDELSDRDRSRIRNTSGRVKSKRRAWRKLQQAHYAGAVSSTDDIPEAVHDLVGLRLTCTNLRDVEMVQAALDALPTDPTRARPLYIDRASERDYLRAPKDSGYRGWHVNLGLLLDTESGPAEVTCELQVRTLLQDSWGELTHEDTYSKDGELPPLVEVLSKRIADLFATLDDIAEDLRTELDRIDDLALAEAEGTEITPDPLTASGPASDAASLLLDRWNTIDRPVDLASLAWELQREFGAEISDDWFGHRSFKRFLQAAVPGGEISTGRQAYLLPADRSAELEAAGVGEGPTTASTAAQRLRAVDRSFPLLDTERWELLFRYLAQAWGRLGRLSGSPRDINRLTRSARDRAEAAGTPVARRHVDHVAKLVVGDGSSDPPDAEQIAQQFAELVVARAVELRILESDDRRGQAALRRWITGE